MSTAHGRISTTPRPGARGTSGWVAWVAFAAILLAFMGTVHVVEGLVALVDPGFYAVPPEGLLVQLDYTAWGWIHLGGGVVLYAAALGVFAGRLWARGVGVLAAVASALGHLAFLAAQPFWSTIVIALCVVVVVALTVHGDEIRA